MFEPRKSTEELYIITLKNDAKFEEELTFALKNDMRNLHFNGLLLSKVYNVLARGAMCHDPER